tara:strand:+ start:396 stop:608 length:213 start_codon:yes stop_codon:yes gene_type:complete
MKILKTVLLLSGVALIAAGLYNTLVPQEVLEVGAIDVSVTEGFTSQSIAMVILGLLCIVTGIYLKSRKVP